MENAVTWSTLASIFSAITAQVTVANVVAVIAGALALGIGFVFLYWAGRKGVRILMSAFRKGRVSV